MKEHQRVIIMRIQYPWKRDTTKYSSPWEPEQFTWLTINFHVRDSAHTYIHTTHLLCKTLQKTTKENNAIISVLRQVTTATVIRTVTLEYQWRYCCSTSKGRWQTLKVKLSAKLNKLFLRTVLVAMLQHFERYLWRHLNGLSGHGSKTTAVIQWHEACFNSLTLALALIEALMLTQMHT